MKPVFLTAARTWDIVIGVLNASGAGLTDCKRALEEAERTGALRARDVRLPEGV